MEGKHRQVHRNRSPTVAVEAVQLLAGNGSIRDYAVERMARHQIAHDLRQQQRSPDHPHRER